MRIVVVSNRLPFTVHAGKDKLEYIRSSGGLTTGLWSYLEQQSAGSSGSSEILWLGWPGASIPKAQQPEVVHYACQAFHAHPVFLPEDCMESFYYGFCNRTVWPLFHYFPSIARYEEEYWLEYKEVNRRFSETVLGVLRPDDLLWVHDYHLMLLPALVREHFPQMPIGFFLHIPFPSYEVFRLLPRSWRVELIEGLLGSSLIGFHTHDYARDFLSSVLRTAGYEHQLGLLTLHDRVVKVDTFPMGIDFDRFAVAAAAPETQIQTAELQVKCTGMKVIFSVDRLDYTKGLLNRLRGYELFLKRNPQWHGKVVFLLSVAPSRIGVESYRDMKRELERVVGKIIGAYGNMHWTPLVYQYRNVEFADLVAMYRMCDVAMITPLRDGMNLVAKEFVACRPQHDGVLILSEMAGAAKEMGEALIVNPFHPGEVAHALEQALTMPAEEQARRIRVLQDRLRRYNINRWGDDFIETLVATHQTEAARRARSLTGKAQTSLVQQFQTSRRAAFLLDYDGTLVPFVENPRLALPDTDLLGLLASLSAKDGNEVAVISGRARADLEGWFGHLPLTLVAEHGAWVRPRHGEWHSPKPVAAAWKERVRPILQLYEDRLPGAIIEEKDFSLAWHFRRADPEQASLRAKELLDDLADYTRNIDVQVLEGNKVLEVRNTGMTKGTAAAEWLASISPDFILAMGDDWTDEDLFRALPPTAFSVRVGLAKTAARYHLGSHTAVRRLLRSLLDLPRQKELQPVSQPAG